MLFIRLAIIHPWYNIMSQLFYHWCYISLVGFIHSNDLRDGLCNMSYLFDTVIRIFSLSFLSH